MLQIPWLGVARVSCVKGHIQFEVTVRMLRPINPNVLLKKIVVVS